MKKVLITISTEFYPTGGLTTVMMNYYRAINKEELQIDFASTNLSPPRSLISELEQHGSSYYCIGKRSHIVTYFYVLYKLCKKYDIVHVNGNSATTAVELLAAKLAGVKERLDHNHNAKTGHRFINALLKPLFKRLYTVGLACSEPAGDWLFGEGNFVILNNAIDVDRFRFSKSFREHYRKEWNIAEDTFVIGHVGKMNFQKNHDKLIDIFFEYQRVHSNSCLLCIGYGPLQNELEKKIEELGLQNKIILAGLRTDIPAFLCAMDMFIFPSRWEGLALAVIEAQASGLPCLVSDRLAKATFVTSQIKAASLDMSSVDWAVMIDKMIVFDREKQSRENVVSITHAGYNIVIEADKLRKIYME